MLIHHALLKEVGKLERYCIVMYTQEFYNVSILPPQLSSVMCSCFMS